MGAPRRRLASIRPCARYPAALVVGFIAPDIAATPQRSSRSSQRAPAQTRLLVHGFTGLLQQRVGWSAVAGIAGRALGEPQTLTWTRSADLKLRLGTCTVSNWRARATTGRALLRPPSSSRRSSALARRVHPRVMAVQLNAPLFNKRLGVLVESWKVSPLFLAIRRGLFLTTKLVFCTRRQRPKTKISAR